MLLSFEFLNHLYPNIKGPVYIEGIAVKKILVIDDELSVREMLRRVLSSEGLQVATAPGAEQGLEHLFREPVDLLILDDFALEPMSKEESRDVYQLFLERTGRASMIVTSNRDTAEWLAMFDEVLLAQSAVDRFKNAAYDFVIEGESYRPRLKPKVDEADTPPQFPAPKPRLHPRARARRRR